MTYKLISRRSLRDGSIFPFYSLVRTVARFIFFSVLVTSFFSIISVTSVHGMDKRTPIHILPERMQGVHVVLGNLSMTSNQYNLGGSPVSTVKYDIVSSKFIARATYIKNLELCIEAPYLFKMSKRAYFPNGTMKDVYDDNGLGDVSLQLTYQWLDGKKNKNGFITGIEFKLPTGNEDKGIGTGSYDYVFRTVYSRKNSYGHFYGMLIYTLSGDGQINAVEANYGDDLYLAVGLKTKPFKKIGFDVRGFLYKRTSEPVRPSPAGSAATFDKYDIPGFRLETRYLPKRKTEIAVFYEAGFPEDHNYITNNMTFRKEPGTRHLMGLITKFFW